MHQEFTNTLHTPRALHITALICVAITLTLMVVVAYEDSSNWGYLQHFGVVLMSSLLGAGALNSIHALIDAD